MGEWTKERHEAMKQDVKAGEKPTLVEATDMLAEIERLQASAKANEEHCAALERMTQDYMRRYGVL